MTDERSEPTRRRRWPWSSRTSFHSDVVIGLALLFFVDAAVLIGKIFGYGTDIWAAQGEKYRIDAAQLASIAWTEYFLFGTLVIAAIAALARAPWTVVLQLLVAGALAVFLVFSQHDYERTHPGPPPTPPAGYTPCYSGSGTCDETETLNHRLHR